MFIFPTVNEKKFHRLALFLSLLLALFPLSFIWWNPHIIVETSFKVLSLIGVVYIMFCPVVAYMANPEEFKDVYLKKLN